MGRGYSAGTLSFEFTGKISSASKALDTMIKKLRTLKTATETLSLSKLDGLGQKLENIFNVIANANYSGIDKLANGIKTISSLAKTLSSINFDSTSNGLKTLFGVMSRIPKIGFDEKSTKSIQSFVKMINTLGRMPDILKKLENVDFSNVSKSFEKLTDSIKPFLTEITKAEKALTSLSNIINKIGGKGGLFGKKGKNGGFLGGLFNAVSWGISIRSGMRFGAVMADIAKKGSDYTETLNKWQVAMDGNLDKAQEFVDKMNDAYGISRETLMNAQSTFRNMIGSLGQISDDVAFSLSESITQMAIDYSSLYNVELETAFSKFQSVLAGQVRPIRTDSGFDITETTLFQLYQSLGGEKSMRQLTRTEKQLLSILSIYKQMGRSGALGDMSKTIGTYANQTRMMRENWKELVTWIGISVQYLLESNNVLTYINAAVIVLSRVAKQFAYSIGYVDPDFGLGWSENIEDANLALDEMQGKLAGFDKFNALNSSGSENLAIDQVLQDSLAGYTSFLKETENPANKLADSFFEIFGGEENVTEKVKEALPWVTAFLGVLTGLGLINLVSTFATNIINPISAITLGVSLLIAGITSLANAWGNMDNWQRAVSIILAVAGAIAGVYVAIRAFKASVPVALAMGAALAGAIMLIYSYFTSGEKIAHRNVTDMETGGVIPASKTDSGTIFRAGENGKTEAIYTAPNGSTNVANVQQMKAAFYGALVDFSKTGSGESKTVVVIDGEPVFNVVQKTASQKGLAFVKKG